MRLRLSTKIIIAFVVAMLLAWAGLLVIGYALVGQPFHEMLHFQQSLEATELITSSARESLLYSLAFIALIAVVGGVFIHRRLSPIYTLVAYADAVSRGEETELEFYRADCLGHLAESLRNMVGKLRHQAHWYESILNSMPYSVAVTDRSGHALDLLQHGGAQIHGQGLALRGSGPALLGPQGQSLRHAQLRH